MCQQCLGIEECAAAASNIGAVHSVDFWSQSGMLVVGLEEEWMRRRGKIIVDKESAGARLRLGRFLYSLNSPRLTW